MKYLNEYIKLINSGEKLVNNHIKSEVLRIKKLEQKYEYDQKAAHRPIKFIEKYCHNTKGSKELLILELEQKVWIECAFGLYFNRDGIRKRLIRELFILISRGSGKSTLAAALTIYMMCADGEQGADCSCVALTEKQAGIIFNTTRIMTKYSPEIEQHVKKRKGNLMSFDLTDSKFEILVNEYEKMDGLNNHFTAYDEIHVYKEDTIKVCNDGGFKKRKNPMAMYITTNGTTRDKLFDRMLSNAEDITHGVIEKDRQLNFLYCLENIEEIHNEKNWIKAIPFLGSLLSFEDLREEVKECENDPIKQGELVSKTFGISVNDYASYFTVEECKQKFKFTNEFTGELDNYKNFILGSDFADVNDFCSLSLTRIINNEVYVKWLRFIPRAGLDNLNNELKKQYLLWEKEGLIIIHDNPKNQQNEIFEYFKKHCETNMLHPILHGFDPWNAKEFTRLYNDYYGQESVSISQNAKTYSNPMKGFKEDIKAKKIHFNDPVASWCIKNVVVKIDANKNIYPNKKQANNKIDDFMSLMNSIIAYENDKENLQYYMGDSKKVEELYDFWDLNE